MARRPLSSYNQAAPRDERSEVKSKDPGVASFAIQPQGVLPEISGQRIVGRLNSFSLMKFSSLKLVATLLLCTSIAFSQNAHTQLVILGTGTPIINPDRSGPSVAVVVNGSAYLIDFGPGVVRRAAAAARDKSITALTPKNLKVVFATHLHSDHTAGLSDLYLTPAVEGRPGALELYGPPGIADMARHIQAAYVKDVGVRVHGLEHGNANAYHINAHEIHPGIVYQDTNVKVTAFAVAHGTWDFSYGYRFDTADRSIVISGDTAPTEAIARACHGCDLLLHEVYSTAWFQQRTPAWQKYHSTFHTSTTALAKIANAAKPKQLVLYHQLFRPADNIDAVLIDELRKAGYTGPVASAHDLDVFKKTHRLISEYPCNQCHQRSDFGSCISPARTPTTRPSSSSIMQETKPLSYQ